MLILFYFLHLKFSKHGEASNKIFFKLTFYTYSCYKYHLVSHIYLYITNAMQKKHYMFPLKVCTATTRKTRTLAKNTVIIFKLNVVVTYSNVSKRCRWSWKQCSLDLQEQSDLERAVWSWSTTFCPDLCVQMSHIMRKHVYAICKQQRHRSACASAQSDECLCC